METQREDLVSDAKKPYEAPQVVSEQMFDTHALACGKCTSGSFPQFACGSLPNQS